jgi:signal transduction histidine kinase
MKRPIALKIAIAYFLAGFLWILFSDLFLSLFINDIELLTKLQTYKGWFYIVLTTFFLYFLLQNEFAKKNRIAAELEKAKIKAEESDRLKTAFLSNMSHEIRTPLNGILGFSNLISKEDLSRESKELYSELITLNGHLLLKLINDIIEISKIQENQIEVNMKKFDLNLLISQLYEQYQLINPKIKQNIVVLHQHKAMPGKPYYIVSDPERVQQIMINLIDNAVKFLPSGEIIFGYNIRNGEPELFVEDNGIGIPEKEQEKLFTRFNQSHSSVGHDGFGLGLAISKGLVEILGGQINVDSELGKGNRFYFNIPQKNQVAV